MPLATPTLAIADGANGGGGVTATITVGDAAATNTLYSQKVDGELGTSTWTSRGSRTGNGTIVATVTANYFWWKCMSVLGAETTVSNLVYMNLTNGTDAVYNQILDGVKARVASMALTGVAAARTYKRWVPVDDQLVQEVGKDKFPIVLICPARNVTEIGSLNAVDDVGYPVLAGIADANNQDFDANFNKYLTWLEKINAGFRHQALPGVSKVWNCEVESLPVPDQEQYRKNLFACGSVLRFFVREGRGI